MTQTITPLFNIFNQLEVPNLTLCNPNKTEKYSLRLASDITNKICYNALSELTFDYARTEGSEDIYDAINGKMVILLEDIGTILSKQFQKI